MGAIPQPGALRRFIVKLEKTARRSPNGVATLEMPELARANFHGYSARATTLIVQEVLRLQQINGQVSVARVKVENHKKLGLRCARALIKLQLPS